MLRAGYPAGHSPLIPVRWQQRLLSVATASATAFSSAGLVPAAIAAPRQPPPVLPSRPANRAAANPSVQEGGTLVINGRSQEARWRWIGPSGQPPQQLWLTLEVLQNQLGVSSRSLPDGSLDLEWFGEGLKVPTAAQQALADEVALDALPLLQALGVRMGTDGQQLSLNLPSPNLVQVRSSVQGAGRRVVLDLAAPALVRQDGSELVVDISGSSELQAQLRQLGLVSRSLGPGLALRSTAGVPQRIFTLGQPNRLVIDLPSGGVGSTDPAPTPISPRLQALLGRGVRWDRLSRSGVRINAVRVEPRNGPLRLAPLPPTGGMEGLLTLPQLAQQTQALVAINGGYFNRVRRLPLGALKQDGRWLSGPILNRGVAAWSGRELPRFGRLSLQEWVSGPDGGREPLVVVNSGYVQRGISRYDDAWGPIYRPLSGGETALLVRQGVAAQDFNSQQLEQGVPLRPGDTLLVGRGGVAVPWTAGSRLSFSSRPSTPLGDADQVVGGGPLLLQEGRLVLNGAAENFAAAFMRQGAPRTVLASDGVEVWLVTLEGENGAGPTLEEAARLLLQLGVRDALNLDGGSSTGLVMGGSLQVKGRGVAGRVHNGVGLVQD
ncbi:MAG: phosphodiester glycosidase family protein [Cyanobacteriota bacterium]